MAKSRKRKSPKRRAVRRKKPSSRKSLAKNKQAHWKAFKQLEKRANQAWTKLRADIKRKASPQVILRDRNQLLLLLGECNYMTRECMRCAIRHR